MINLGRDGMIPRTYHDLLTMGSVYGGPYSKREQMFSLGTRANICRECCERKGDEVLGPIAKAERKARHYVKVAIQRGEEGRHTAWRGRDQAIAILFSPDGGAGVLH